MYKQDLDQHRNKLQHHKREALGIFYGLEKCHQYCCAFEVIVIKDLKPLVATFQKDMAAPLKRLKWILLHIHQYRLGILYKSGPQLYTAGWLSRLNHSGGKY